LRLAVIVPLKMPGATPMAFEAASTKAVASFVASNVKYVVVDDLLCEWYRRFVSLR
jgi:hypothetical protein